MKIHVKVAVNNMKCMISVLAMFICAIAHVHSQSWIPNSKFGGYALQKCLWSTDGQLYVVAMPPKGAVRLYKIPVSSLEPQLVLEDDTTGKITYAVSFLANAGSDIMAITPEGLRTIGSDGMIKMLPCLDTNQQVSAIHYDPRVGMQLFSFRRLAEMDSTSYVEYMVQYVGEDCDTVYRVMPYKRLGQPSALGFNADGSIQVVGFNAPIRSAGMPLLRRPDGTEIGNMTVHWKTNHDVRCIDHVGDYNYIMLERRTRDVPHLIVRVDANWNVVDTLSLGSTRENIVATRLKSNFLTVVYDTSLTYVNLESMRVAHRIVQSEIKPFMDSFGARLNDGDITASKVAITNSEGVLIMDNPVTSVTDDLIEQTQNRILIRADNGVVRLPITQNQNPKGVLYDAIGQPITSHISNTGTTLEIETADLVPGVYFVCGDRGCNSFMLMP